MEYWNIARPGHIFWQVAGAHQDKLEMSGQGCSVQVEYGVAEDGRLFLEADCVYPGLRTRPNDTHASLIWHLDPEALHFLRVDGEILRETPKQFDFDGILTVSGHQGDLKVQRKLFPSRKDRYALERVTLENTGARPVRLEVLPWEKRYTKGAQGYYEQYPVVDSCPETLRSGESVTVTACFTAQNPAQPCRVLSGDREEELRREFCAQVAGELELETPDPVLNNAFALAKLRAAESVFRTKSGLMHCPGGLRYYAAVWANDQVEYAGPFFPYLGEENAVEASKNAYELYLPFMSSAYWPMPSSIIAEGMDIWDGAGDRGDGAMYAYGAAAFLLTLGDRAYARKMLPAVEWCLEYCRRKTTAEGVIASDTDELENRFPSGNANLSTACLTYGGLLLGAILEEEFGRTAKAAGYRRQAEDLEKSIEAYFGANVEGFDTYRYYDGNDKLRAWICLPLVFGITRREQETARALLSDKLLTIDGLATESGDKVFWDRSSLYALRGLFRRGYIREGAAWLSQYSRRRTLGEHVPYPVEAWPEGDQRHLSAESALYCRVFTEGLFGLEPAGLDRMKITPHMPEDWDLMTLRRVHLQGKVWNLTLRREKTGLVLTVTGKETEQIFRMEPGETVLLHTAEL